MNESQFKELIEAARRMGGDYAAGYQRGLRRHYHGEKFGSADEHATWKALDGPRQDMGDGYRDGFAGLAPKRRPGRPTTVAGMRRNIMIDDERAQLAIALGNGNLSEGIRRALDIVREIEGD